MAPKTLLVEKIRRVAVVGPDFPPPEVFMQLMEEALDTKNKEAARLLCYMTEPVGEASFADKLSVDQLSLLFSQSVGKKDWEAVKILCEITQNMRRITRPFDEHSVKKFVDLSGNDRVIYDMQRVFRAGVHQPIYGPLPKSAYTEQLVSLARELMLSNGDQIVVTTNKSGEQFFKLPSGNTYNWTKIRKLANLQHVLLQGDDFSNYTEYLTSIPSWRKQWIPTLDKSKVVQYQADLYKCHSLPIDPNDRICFQEMQAINIYTGGAYSCINNILRGQNPSQALRDALITSVIAASGLRKLPTTSIKDTYRKTTVFNLDEQRAAAANRAVISISGFVSTSTDPNKFQAPSAVGIMRFHYTNVTGIYVVPISQLPWESEFLMLPGQFRYVGYDYDQTNKDHYFEVQPATDLSSHLIDNTASTHEVSDKEDSYWLLNPFRIIQWGMTFFAPKDNPVEESASPAPLPKFIPKPVNLEQAMSLLHKKVEELRDGMGSPLASDIKRRIEHNRRNEAAFDLEAKLNKLIVRYFEKREIDLTTFKQDCHVAIDEARPFLTTGPDNQWATLLNRLKLIIQQLIHKVSFGHFFKKSNKEPSIIEVIDDIKEQVSNCKSPDITQSN